MWLLDVNLPNGVTGFLKKQSIDCDTTVTRGWRDLGNGILVEAASKAGFKVILTRDKLFGESAARAFNTFPRMQIILCKPLTDYEFIF